MLTWCWHARLIPKSQGIFANDSGFRLTGICALAAKKTGRPVRCMLNRDEDMITSGQRHPFLGRWKVAVNKDGKIQALDADVFCNAGMYSNPEETTDPSIKVLTLPQDGLRI